MGVDAIKNQNLLDMQGELVCELCGVRYPSGDAEHERGHRDAHFSGKMHAAYKMIQEEMERILEKRRKLGTDQDPRKKKDERHERKQKRARDESKDRSRSRDLDRKTDRMKDRSKRKSSSCS